MEKQALHDQLLVLVSWDDRYKRQDSLQDLSVLFKSNVPLQFFISDCLLVVIFVPQGSCVGLYFVNRPEWLVVDHACSAYSFVSVPLYDTLG